MSTKHSRCAWHIAAVLSVVMLLGGVTSQSFSAPAPAPAPAPTQSPFGRLVPVAPTGPTGAGVAGAPAPTAPAAAPPGAPPPAAAAAAASGVTAPRIIVIDRQLILQRSSAGKDMVTQTQNLSKQAETQFRGEEEGLQKEAVTLQQQMAILAADVRTQKEKDFTTKQQAFQTRVQQRQAQIQAGFNNAARQLEVALDPILQTIMKERGANMVLDRSAVIVASVDVDVTNIAVQRLDQKLPHIKVDLAPVPVAAPAPAGAPAPAPAVAAAPAAPAAAAPAAPPRPAVAPAAK